MFTKILDAKKSALLRRAFLNTHTNTCQTQFLKVTDCLCWTLPLKNEHEKEYIQLSPGQNILKVIVPKSDLENKCGSLHSHSIGCIDDSVLKMQDQDQDPLFLKQKNNDKPVVSPIKTKSVRVRPAHRLKTHVLNLCSKKSLRQIISSGENPTCGHCLKRLGKQLTKDVSKMLATPSFDI